MEKLSTWAVYDFSLSLASVSIFPVLLFSLLHAATYTKKVLDVSTIHCVIQLILLVFLGFINRFELQLCFPLAIAEELE